MRGNVLCCALGLGFGGVIHAALINFGPISVPGNTVIFDPDNVLSVATLASLGFNGPLGAAPAVQALSFAAASGQTVTFTATGLVGCCGSANIGPDGYTGGSNINSLQSISGFVAPVLLPLTGVFTNGSPAGAAPAGYNYFGGAGQSSFFPLLNQVFFIGDGLTGTGSGSVQTFHVPAGASELWLGFADAQGFASNPGFYGDNPGTLMVSGTLNTEGGAGDTTPPLVTPMISGTSGNNGWYRSSVKLSWSVTDPESGIASSTGCAPATLTSDTAGTKITCSATNGVGLTASASVTIKIDQTLPTVALFGTIVGPPKQVQISSIDVTSGLQTIQVPTCTNCTASTGAFTPGTKNAVITTATKTDATKGSSVKVIATDMAGNSTIFDPVDMTIQGDGKPEVHTLGISSLEHVVQITNGDPGIHHMTLQVNQVEIPVSPLKNGESRSLDIGTALSAGNNNLITITAFGGRKATAWFVFTEP